MLTQHFQATISPGPNELTLLPEETFLLLQQLHTCLFFQRVTSLVQSIEQLHTQHDTHWFQYLEGQDRNRSAAIQRYANIGKAAFPPHPPNYSEVNLDRLKQLWNYMLKPLLSTCPSQQPWPTHSIYYIRYLR